MRSCCSSIRVVMPLKRRVGLRTTPNAPFCRSMYPSRCGSSPEPVTRTSACSVPVTLVSCVVKPWTMPRSMRDDWMRRSIASPRPAVDVLRLHPAGSGLNALSGSEPFAVSSTPGACTSRASMPIRWLAKLPSAVSDWYLNCWNPPFVTRDVAVTRSAPWPIPRSWRRRSAGR